MITCWQCHIPEDLNPWCSFALKEVLSDGQHCLITTQIQRIHALAMGVLELGSVVSYHHTTQTPSLTEPPVKVKVKVKFTLEQAMKAQRGSTLLYSFLNLSTRWSWVVNATSQPLYSQERPSTHCIGVWVGPRASLDGCRKSRPHRDLIPRPSSP